MVVRTIGSVVVGASSVLAKRRFSAPCVRGWNACSHPSIVLYRLPHPKHKGYEAHGGYLRDEAIMILRRFYITENTNGKSLSFAVALSLRTAHSSLSTAPVPKSKANRVLKTEIPSRSSPKPQS